MPYIASTACIRSHIHVEAMKQKLIISKIRKMTTEIILHCNSCFCGIYNGCLVDDVDIGSAYMDLRMMMVSGTVPPIQLSLIVSVLLLFTC